MKLLPGYRLARAPFFPIATDWSQRVRLSTGTEQGSGRVVPRLPWRAATEDELAVLCQEERGERGGELANGFCLFRLPDHLRSGWWRLLEQGDRTVGRLPGLEEFVARVAEFLAFKQLAIPAGAVVDLVVSQPGMPSLRSDGLSFDVEARTPVRETESSDRRLWGGIHLGDEATSVILVNLSAQQIEALLAEREPGVAPPCSYGELARRFLSACPGYPAVRVRIEPGEGYRLPFGGILCDGCTLDKEEPDVSLLIRQGAAR